MVKVDEHSNSNKQIPSFLHIDYLDKTSKQEIEELANLFIYCGIVYIWNQNKVNQYYILLFHKYYSSHLILDLFIFSCNNIQP